MGVDQAQEGDRRRAPRQALHEARARDHGGRARGRRRPRRQPRARARDPEGQGRLDAQGQHRARDRQGHRRGRRRRRARDRPLRGLRPGGVAILVEALTDNRNRTGSEVRHIFTKHGGSLGEPGSVGLPVRQEGRDRGRRRALRRGRPDRRRSTPAPRTSRLDDDVFEVAHRARPTWPPCAPRSTRPGVEIETRRGDPARPRPRVPVDEDGAGQADAADRRARGPRRRRRRPRELRRGRRC